jgi:hypothetical protein
MNITLIDSVMRDRGRSGSSEKDAAKPAALSSKVASTPP